MPLDINWHALLFTETIGLAESPTKFSTLDWIDQVDDLGIIAGGMEDGVITLWNVKKLLPQSDSQ